MPGSTTTFDHSETKWMRQALRLARRGRGRVEPNPMVGCVLVRDDKAVGQGWHRRFGGPHAEVEALRRAGPEAKGATAFVTLEPCSHQGKTPPCTDALLAAGIKRVVTAMEDPFPEVSGQGMRMLRTAGVRVDLGLCREEAAELNAPYLTLLLRNRPYVIAKWAQSLDGKIATASRDSKWVSGEGSRRMVHKLRARVDGILVGVGTVQADDPQLTARNVRLRRMAVRIVLDTNLHIRPGCRLVASAADVPLWVCCSRKSLREQAAKADRLRRASVKIVSCKTAQGRVDVADVLRTLGEARMTNLLVEGGGAVLTSFLDRGLVDEARAFIAPRLIGGAGAVSVYGGKGTRQVADVLSPHTVRVSRSGEDMLVRMRF